MVQHYAPWRLEDLLVSNVISDIEGHNIRDFIIGDSDSNESNPIADELINVFKEVQLYLELTGIYWEITGYRLKTIENISTYNDSISEYTPLVLSGSINSDWSYEEFGGCQLLQTL